MKHRNGQQLRPAELIDKIAQAIVSHAPQEGYFSTAVPGLSLYRRHEVSSCYPSSYEPSVHVFAQGQKRITLGETTYLCKRGTFLLSSVDLPAVSQVVEASKTKPVLSLV